MSANYRPRTGADQRAAAEAARADKLAALHERLADQVAALRTGQDWQRWLTVAARFHTYSFNNTLLILAQRPDATQVAGYEAWKSLGRHVTKGEKGIAILAPLVGRNTSRAHAGPDPAQSRPAPAGPPGQVVGDGPAGEQPDDRRVVGYRVTHVWDICQTQGTPLPAQPQPELLRGQAPDGLWDALAALTATQGYILSRGDCGTANGLTDPARRTVRIRADIDDAQAVKTLAHELAHVRLHATDGALAACRGLIEVEAESVAHLVTTAHGLDSGGYTFPYVTGWASSLPGQAPEDVVRATGCRVLAATRWILGTCHDEAPSPELTGAQQLAERALAGAARTGDVRAKAALTLSTARVAEHTATSREVGPGRFRTNSWRRSFSRGSADRPVAPEELLALHRQAAVFFRDQLADSWVPAYLHGRGLAASLDNPWLAGYAPRGWTSLVDQLREIGADDATLLTAGLATRARTGGLIDRFRDRLVLPIRAHRGDIVGFIGRAHPEADPDRTPRYLNSPDTPLYTKSEHLHGLHESAVHLARGARPVLVEGPLDAIAVTTGTGGRCAGIALCGTALTAAHLDALTAAVDLRQRGLVVATDPDQAGQTAATKALIFLANRGLSATAAVLPPGEDPAETLHTRGPAALTAALLDHAVPLADVVVDHHVDRWNDQLHTVEGRVGALRDVTPLVAGLPIGEIRRQAARLTQRLDLASGTVHQEIAARIRLEPPAPHVERDHEATHRERLPDLLGGAGTRHLFSGSYGRRP